MSGEARGPNIIAASIEAYIKALNALLAEAHWSGATEAAGNRKGVAVRPARRGTSGPSSTRTRRRTTRRPGSSARLTRPTLPSQRGVVPSRTAKVRRRTF